MSNCQYWEYIGKLVTLSKLACKKKALNEMTKFIVDISSQLSEKQLKSLDRFKTRTLRHGQFINTNETR